MIKTWIPSIHAMTGLALCCESRGFVIDGFCTVEIIDVTECAISIESPEHADCGALVAVLALHGRMRSDKRKPVFMSVDILDNLAPSANAMALLTIAAELTAMNIRVTTGALCPDV